MANRPPQMLWGGIHSSNFGHRAATHNNPQTAPQHPDSSCRRDAKRRRRERHLYEPKTQETRAAYEDLLDVFRQQLGAQPLDVLGAAADEVLATLKDDSSPATKKKQIEKLINPISDEMFAQLVFIGNRITDFDQNQVQDCHDDRITVSDDAAAPAASHDSHGASCSVQPNKKKYAFLPNTMIIMGDDQNQVQDDDVVNDDDVNDDDGDMYNDDSSQAPAIDAQDIDAHWLERKVCQAYDASEIDSQQGQHLAEEILKIMADGSDDRDAENRLAALFDYDKFDLIKLLLHNRLKVVWCTRLARAQHQEQRRKMEGEMASDPILAPILDQLPTARASQGENEGNEQ